MPAHERSLRLTDAYRRRLFALREQLQVEAVKRWPDDPANTDWPDRMASVVEQAQIAAVRLTGAYLTAFVGSETGKATRAIAIDTRAYSGSTADGKPLAEGLRSPLIGMLSALKRGRDFTTARKIGLDRATRQVGMNYDASHRAALSDTIHASPFFDGWHRALRGTCGACAASAAGLSHALWFPAHPGCQCVQEPNVVGTVSHFARPTGVEIFHQKTREEQDQMLGPETAEKVRTGEVAMSDLVAHSHLDSEQHSFITQKPLQAAE